MGKDERFHETLNGELLQRRQWQGIRDLQAAFALFRQQYNLIRADDALGLEVSYRETERGSWIPGRATPGL